MQGDELKVQVEVKVAPKALSLPMVPAGHALDEFQFYRYNKYLDIWHYHAPRNSLKVNSMINLQHPLNEATCQPWDPQPHRQSAILLARYWRKPN